MYGKVGVINAAEGTVNPLRTMTDGSLAVAHAGGFYADAAINGRLFHASNQAVVATTAGLATTWTGLGIANPSNSTKLLVMHQFSYALNVVGPAHAAIGLMETTNSGFASVITPRPARPGAGTSIALVDDGATIATPVLIGVFGATSTGAITTQMMVGPNVIMLDGSVVIPPGYAICTYTGAACTAALIFSFLWEEVPV